jgi:heat shock protein 4
LGGRDFDQILADFFVEEFKAKYKMDIRTNPKALFRLRSQCERVKKILSANAQAPMNVECLMNDKDVSGMVERYN